MSIAVAQEANRDGKCECPVIAPIATSINPDLGKVYQELDFPALEAIFSNRATFYDGDWYAALAALAHDIDPTGAWQIWSKGTPAPKALAGLQEGGLAGLLISGSLTPTKRGDNPWRGQTSGRVIMMAMIATVARANKYGEPTFRLRESVLRGARFLFDDLAAVPLSIEQSVGRARTVKSVAYDARGGLIASLRGPQRSPEEQAKILAERVKSRPKDVLPLDLYDEANAALDILASLNEKGQIYLSSTFRENDSAALVAELVNLAAQRQIFGGSAQPGTPQDAVACKAFAILSKMIDADSKDGERFRNEIFRMFAEAVYSFDAKPTNIVPTDPPHMLDVTRTFLVQAGVASAEEAVKRAKYLFELADSWSLSHSDTRVDAVLTTMRAVAAYSGGAGRDSHRDDFMRGFDELFAKLALRTGSPDSVQLIAKWKKAAAGVRQLMAAKLCLPDPAPPRLLLFAKSVHGLIAIGKLYQTDLKHIPEIEVPLVLGLYFDNPPEEASYPVTIDGGGLKLYLDAKSVDAARKVFYTEVFTTQPK